MTWQAKARRAMGEGVDFLGVSGGNALCLAPRTGGAREKLLAVFPWSYGAGVKVKSYAFCFVVFGYDCDFPFIHSCIHSFIDSFRCAYSFARSLSPEQWNIFVKFSKCPGSLCTQLASLAQFTAPILSLATRNRKLPRSWETLIFVPECPRIPESQQSGSHRP